MFRHAMRAVAHLGWVACCVLPLAGNAQEKKSGPILIPPPHQDISGTWWASSADAKVRPVDGGEMPFTAAGLQAYRQNMAALKAGSLIDEARTYCVPDGMPRILATPYPFQVFQTPGQVTLVYEMNQAIRLVHMDKPLPGDEELELYPYYLGNSYGRWDGDTLVIETAGFNEKTFIDATGVPHSDKMHVVERIRKVNGGRQLENVVTVRDPANFSKPWTARFLYDHRPDIRLQDYVCGEKHRDLSGVKGAF
jgi:hypothetical protein